MGTPSFLNIYVKGETAFAFWNTLSKFIAVLNSFIVFTVLTLYQFGLYQLVLAFIGIVGAFMFIGINGVVVNDLIRFEKEGKRGAANKLLKEYILVRLFFGLVLFVAVFLGGGWIASLYGKDIGLFIRIASFILVLDSVMQILNTFLTAKLNFSILAVQSFAREAFKLALLSFFLLFSTLGIREVLLSYVGSAGLLAFGLTIFSLPKLKDNFGETSQQSIFWDVFKSYGKWAIFRAYLKQVNEKIGVWLIKFFISTEAVALFILAGSLVDVLKSFFPDSVLTALISREVSDTERFRRIFSRGIKYFFILSLIFLLFGMTVFPPIINLLISKYQPAMPFFKVMLFSLPFFAILKLLSATLIAHRDQYIFFLRTLMSSLILLLLAPLFYSVWGLWGAVAIYLADYGLAVLLLFGRVFKFHPGLSFSVRDFFVFDAYDRVFIQNLGREFVVLFRKTLRIK